MKKIVLLFCLSLMVMGVQAQYTYKIGGNEFDIEVNRSERTAKIVDYEHKIDDHEFPVYQKNRKFKSLYGETLKVPETVYLDGDDYTITGIGRAAFAEYVNFTSVIIPETVTEIGDYAFYRTSVVNVVLPASVERIGDRAFGRCTKLKRLVLPKKIREGVDIYAESKRVVVERIEPSKQQQSRPSEERNYNNAPLAPQNDYAQNTKKEQKKVKVDIKSDIDDIQPSSQSTADNTFAVIIANEDYINDPKVEFAKRDGALFREYCSNVLGLPAENIRYRENVTNLQILTDVTWMEKVAKAFDGEAKFLFYYAGHGVADEKGENAYLLPVNGDSKTFSSGYSLKELYKGFGHLNTPSICVFIDACFSGSGRDGGLLVAARGARRVQKETLETGNMVVFTAAQDDETAHAYPEKGHGIFSYFLMKKLKETKGDVTLGDLSDYIDANVRRRAVVSLGKNQTPYTGVSPKLANTWKKMKLK